MTLSKKEQYKRLSTYDDKRWKVVIERIEDTFLRNKVACILFWDFCGVPGKSSQYLRELTRFHNVKEHDPLVTEEELYKALMKIGYPSKEARRRCKEPKTHRS